MTSPTMVVLFDVDNTLLDNDRVTADLKRHLEQEVGPMREQEYWKIFERLRRELGYVDYLGALQRYRLEFPRDPHLLTVSRFLVNYPFADRLFPQALEVVRHVRAWGKAVILSDGDVVFQPRKIDRSGLLEAVEGNVRGVANRALREALAAGKDDASGALASYMDGRGWLSAGKRVRVALKRRLGLGAARPAAVPALSFQEVLRMYAAGPEENP